MISLNDKNTSQKDSSLLGRRAAEAMDVVRIMDRTLELMFAASTDVNAKEMLSSLRSKIHAEKEVLVERVGKIYEATYTAGELGALVDFLESDAGKAMRTKQGDVESKIQQSTTEFLQSLITGNR